MFHLISCVIHYNNCEVLIQMISVPPGLKVSEKAFGSGRRLPIVQQWTGHDEIQQEKENEKVAG